MRRGHSTSAGLRAGATLNGATALFGFIASLREKQLVAFPLMVSFGVIMSAEFGQSPRQRTLAEQDQPRQAFLLGRTLPVFLNNATPTPRSTSRWSCSDRGP
jgi:hypothetical protein